MNSAKQYMNSAKQFMNSNQCEITVHTQRKKKKKEEENVKSKTQL